MVRGNRVLAAVSGGPDSSALLIWLRGHGIEVVAAHFDHRLRPGSEADAERVARLSDRLGVELTTGRRDRPLPKGSIQSAARALRYEFLDRAAAAAGCDLIALGHTADDVVEGAVLHLLRGAGLAGMRGMPDRRGPYRRPLTGVWRVEIESYLRALGVEAIDDPSNRDVVRFARARVRYELLPRLAADRPGLELRIRAAARVAAGWQARLEAEAEALAASGRALELARLRSAPAAVRAEAYRLLYSRLRPGPGLARVHLAAMDGVVMGGRTGQSVDLPAGVGFRRSRATVSMEDVREERGPESGADSARFVIQVTDCSGCDDPAAAHLRSGLELSLGVRRPGLRLRPLPSGSRPRPGGQMPGTRKLQDVLTDAHVPRWRRDSLPLVFEGGRLVWVPGIAVDAGAAAPAGSPSTHVTVGRREGGAGSRC